MKVSDTKQIMQQITKCQSWLQKSGSKSCSSAVDSLQTAMDDLEKVLKEK